MKAHKYWSLGALAAMIGTFYTGYKNMKTAHKYFACSSLLCMIMAIYSGHKMISGKSRKRKILFLKNLQNNQDYRNVYIRLPDGINIFIRQSCYFTSFLTCRIIYILTHQ